MSSAPRFRRAPVDLEPLTVRQLQSAVGQLSDEWDIRYEVDGAQVDDLAAIAARTGSVRPLSVLTHKRGEGELLVGCDRTGLFVIMRNREQQPAVYADYLKLRRALEAHASNKARLLGAANRYRGLFVIIPVLLKGIAELAGTHLPDKVFIPLLVLGFSIWLGLWFGTRTEFAILEDKALQKRKPLNAANAR
jgi:hypothetical protein